MCGGGGVLSRPPRLHPSHFNTVPLCVTGVASSLVRIVHRTRRPTQPGAAILGLSASRGGRIHRYTHMMGWGKVGWDGGGGEVGQAGDGGSGCEGGVGCVSSHSPFNPMPRCNVFAALCQMDTVGCSLATRSNRDVSTPCSHPLYVARHTCSQQVQRKQHTFDQVTWLSRTSSSTGHFLKASSVRSSTSSQLHGPLIRSASCWSA